jgi:hypothetical protein
MKQAPGPAAAHDFVPQRQQTGGVMFANILSQYWWMILLRGVIS